MRNLQLSICLNDLRLEPKAAMRKARDLAFHAIDVSAVSGEISPDELSTSGRRQLIRHASDLGLRLGSLRGPVAAVGYADPVAGERRLDLTRGILRLAADLGVPIVSASLGLVEDSPESAARLREALLILADESDRTGRILALDNSGFDPARLRGILTEINCPQLAAACDLGAVLIQGDRPAATIRALAGRLRLLRARDAVPGSPGAPGHETAWGQGALDPAEVLGLAAEAGFSGDIILSRTSGDTPDADLRKARECFERLLI